MVCVLDASTLEEGSAHYYTRLIEAETQVVPAFGELSVEPTSFEAIVITGSAASVTDTELVGGMVRWVQKALQANVPILGCCFGHQLLAASAGLSVKRRTAAEVGFLPVELTPHPLFEGLPNPLVPFVSHEDEVMAAGAVVLATSEACPVHAIEVAPRALGIQFHLEYDESEQERILRYRAERHPELVIEAVPGRSLEREGRIVMRNFLRLVRTD